MTPELGFVLFQPYTWRLAFIVFKYILNIYIWMTFIGKMWDFLQEAGLCLFNCQGGMGKGW